MDTQHLTYSYNEISFRHKKKWGADMWYYRGTFTCLMHKDYMLCDAMYDSGIPWNVQKRQFNRSGKYISVC